MVKCRRCKLEEAVVRIPYAKLNLCKKCFNDFLLKRVKETIEKYGMFNQSDKVGVAISGGKDSATLLHTLKKLFPTIELIAFHVNLGIEGYSDHCLEKASALAKMLNIELFVYDLKKEKGLTIDSFKQTRFKRKICSVCGTIKRQVFNEIAERLGVDVMATGHNLDDTVEVLFSNFLAGDFEQLVKLKPVMQPFHPKLVKKVKPLFRIPEVENTLYAQFNGLPIQEVTCPHSVGSRSVERKKILEFISEKIPNFKYQLLSVFLKKLMPILEEKVITEKTFTLCKLCGYPSLTSICGSCKKILEAKSTVGVS